MFEFQIFEAGQPVNLDYPLGWESLTFSRQFQDGKYLTTELSGSITYCGNIARLLNEKSPCATDPIFVKHKCNRTDPAQIFMALYPDWAARQYQCNDCELTFNAVSNTALARLRNSPEACLSLLQDEDARYQFFQVETGQYYEDFGGFMIPVDTVFQTLPATVAGLAGSGIVNVPILQTPYLQGQTDISFPPLAANDVIQITFTTNIGGQHSYTIEAAPGETQADILQKVCNVMLATNPGGERNLYSLDGCDLIQRVSCCEVNGSVLSVFHDFEVQNLSVTVNGTDISGSGGSITLIQPWQWGLEGLHIWNANLSEGSMCITFDALVDILCCLTPIVVIDNFASVNIEAYQDAFQPTSFPVVSGASTVQEFDQDALCARYQFGSQWDYEETDPEEWVYEKERQQLPLYIGANISTLQGEANFTGTFNLLNPGTTAATAQIRLLINNIQVGISNVFTLNPAPDITTIELPGPQWNATFQECVQIGDQIRWEIVSVSGPAPLITPGQTSFMEVGPLCEDGGPQLDETCLQDDDVFTESVDFAGCGNICDKRCDTNVYTGLGLAISQQIQGLADYQNSYFLSYADLSTFETRRFKKCYFIPPNSSACDCAKGRIIEKYFYNVPLQKPYIIANHAQVIPSDLTATQYVINGSVDGSNVYNYAITPIQEGFVIPKTREAVKLYSFQECFSPSDLLPLLQSNQILVDPCGDGEQLTQLFNLSFNLSDKLADFTVLGT